MPQLQLLRVALCSDVGHANKVLNLHALHWMHLTAPQPAANPSKEHTPMLRTTPGVLLLLALMTALPPAAASEADKKKAEKPDPTTLNDRDFDVVYGIGAAVHYFDTPGPNDRLAMREDVSGAFMVAALRDFPKHNIEIGPMLVSNVAIGGQGVSVVFDSLGLGFMVAWRGEQDDWINGLGIGVAYSFDRNVELTDAGDPAKAMTTSEHAVSVVFTYAFGKSPSGG